MKKNSNIKTALRYAQALYDSFSNVQDLDVCYRRIEDIKPIINENLADFELLNNPLWDLQKKYEIIESLGQKLDLPTNTVNTIKILAKNHRMSLLPQIIDQFLILYRDDHNIAEVEVKTVIPLTAQQDTLLKNKLSAVFKKEIVIKYITDAHIIGGLVIKYGTHFIDASILSKLNALENFMKGKK